MSRSEAAAFVGIGSSHFDGLVRAGALPAPIRVERRRIWSRDRLEAALLALADGQPLPAAAVNGAANPCDAILGSER